MWSPVLFVTAMADPANFVMLIHTGAAGGELGIMLFGLGGGYALTRGGRRWCRICLGILVGLAILVMGFMVGEQYRSQDSEGRLGRLVRRLAAGGLLRGLHNPPDAETGHRPTI